MYIIIPLYISSLTLLIVSEYKDSFKKYHVMLKSITSLIFVLAALYIFMFRSVHNYKHSIIMIVALSLCLIGDIMLSVVQGKAESGWFYAGVASFMLAHFVYFFAFLLLSPFNIYDLIIAAIISVMIYSISRFDCINIEEMKIVLLVYSICLGFFMSKGIIVFFTSSHKTSSILILVGCVLFGISDVTLIFEYFSKKIAILPVFNLTTYYAATMILALSLAA